MKTGLVLEGGAMRGMFTAGVLDVFMENGLKFDGEIGVSAGAAFGCNYKSEQIGRVLRYNVKYCRDKRFYGLRSLLFTGNLYGTDFCYHEIPEKLDIFDIEKFNNNPMEFYIVCTDITSGKPIYKRCDKVDKDCFDWIRASASMPLVSEIVEIDGIKMLDGGIADSIPIHYFENLGYDKNVVVLTQPMNYRKKKNNLMPILKIALRRYPKVLPIIENRYKIYNETLEYIIHEEKKGKIIVIRPDEVLPIKRVTKDADKLRMTYEIGRRNAEKRLDEIKKFIAQ